MFTHQQTLDAINAGLTALGAKPLDGIPVAAPRHTDECVLGCSYKQFGGNLSDSGRSGTIYFELPESARLVCAAWQEVGVKCHLERNHQTIRFSGGLYEWMAAFDGGHWEQLIVPGWMPDRMDWTGDTDPGDYTLDPAELPPVE